MMLPTTIAEASPLDPLVLLPLPPVLPDAAALSAQLAAATAVDLDAPNGAKGIPTPLPALAAGMRGANRGAQTLMNAARTGAAEARAHLDNVDVGLRTVEYELARVRDEMARCMEYEPMYETMDMPTEESFLSSAPSTVIDSLPDDPEARKYALIIARLESELAAVLAAEERVAGLTAERDGLVRARREVKGRFDAVDVWLTDFAKTSNAMATKIKDVTKGAPVPAAKSEPKAEAAAAGSAPGTPAPSDDVPAGPPAA